MDLHKIDKIEIFAVGKWNGLLFSLQDLENIAATFNVLHENHKVPLKFGHNDEQPMTDGYPALGWIDKVWVDTGADGKPKLFAALSDVPTVVYNAIKQKRYRKPSIELDIGVEYKGKLYKYVLSGVALLGADLPAVSTLTDLSHYMERAIFGADTVRMTFSAFDDQPKRQEEPAMSITKEEMEARLAAQKANFEREQLDKEAAVKKEAEELKAKVAEFERKENERAQAEAKNKVKLARDAVNTVLEEGVKKFGLTPAKRDAYRKMFSVDNDDAVVNIDLEALKALIGEDKTKQYSREHAAGSESEFDESKNLPGETAGEKLDYAARKIRDESGGKMNYSAAYSRACEENPKLVAEHTMATEAGRDE